MNFRQTFAADEHSFYNIFAPMLDIVFLLLTFFIVTEAYERQERETPVDLPRTTAAIGMSRGALDLVVNVTRDGRIVLNGQPIPLERFRERLAHRQQAGPVSVIIRADGQARHEKVLRVVDACAAVKVRRVSFVSILEEPRSRD
jgi:biopolymer transport protein ExbD